MEGINIAYGTYLVKLREPVTVAGVEAFADKVMRDGGTIEMVANKGVFIINLDDSHLQEFQCLTMVALMGGVAMARRRIMARS